MSVDRVGVHIHHCCLQHGCKYGNVDCPVAWGTVEQAYKCETCEDAWEENGSPTCSLGECKERGYWEWAGNARDSKLAFGPVKVYFYLCDNDDARSRKFNEIFLAKPKQSRFIPAPKTMKGLV